MKLVNSIYSKILSMLPAHAEVWPSDPTRASCWTFTWDVPPGSSPPRTIVKGTVSPDWITAEVGRYGYCSHSYSLSGEKDLEKFRQFVARFNPASDADIDAANGFHP